MNFPEQLYYTKDHEWVLIEGNTATIGITDFAQKELGDIVYVEVETVGKTLEAGVVFGTVEAVKTVSDLFLPLSGTITALNPILTKQPELVNTDPYGAGWMIKMTIAQPEQITLLLLDAVKYKELVL
ncbi:MAG TPA: glycine cleavage system protein GcvH [Chitinophagaceae bacterium]|nr:glycine cleavage system protein GcvH [Chitinophagaceae bacterium]